MLESVVNLVAPWAAFYGDHVWVATIVAFLHLSGLLWGGGRAVVADALTLRASSLASFLAEGRLDFLAASHRDVLVGLGLSALTGALLFASDLEHYLTSPLYWGKMAVVMVLLVNGVFIRRFEAGLASADGAAAAWGATRRHAVISLMCWFGAMLLGKAVVNA